MFSFEEYFRNPYSGPYALKKIVSGDVDVFVLCDGGRVAIISALGGFRVDDMRKSLLWHGHFRSMKSFKRYGGALSYVQKLNAKAIEKILQSASEA